MEVRIIKRTFVLKKFTDNHKKVCLNSRTHPVCRQVIQEPDI